MLPSLFPFFLGPFDDLAHGSIIGLLGLPFAMRGPSGPCCWPWSQAAGKSHIPGPAHLSGTQGFYVEKSWAPSIGAAKGDACRQRANAVERCYRPKGLFEELGCSRCWSYPDPLCNGMDMGLSGSKPWSIWVHLCSFGSLVCALHQDRLTLNLFLLLTTMPTPWCPSASC